MRNFFIFVSFLWLMLASSATFAVHVRSIYQAEIPVASQDPDIKKKAVVDGLEQVFAKVSGNGHIMEDSPGLKNNLKNADAIVQQFSYANSDVDDKTNPYLLTISYEPDMINKILTTAKIPVWSQNRPLIIVWIAEQSPTHPLDFIDNASQIEPLFKQTAKSKGLPVIFPLGDLADMSALSATDITTKDLTKVDMASKRYQAEAILTGVVTHNASDISSHWELTYGDQGHWSWDVSGKTLQEVLNTINTTIATTLSGRFANVQTEKVETTITLQVSGVKQQEDLMKLMKYLQNVASVSDVQLTSVTGSDIVLDVSFAGTKQALVQALSTSRMLIPVAGTNPQDDTLAYQWSH